MSDDRNLVAILVAEGLSHQGLIAPTHQQLVAALNHSLDETKQEIRLHDRKTNEELERIATARERHARYLEANGLEPPVVVRTESDADRIARKSVPLSEEDKARARSHTVSIPQGSHHDDSQAT